MSKPKYDLEKALLDLPLPSAGLAHGLDLLLLAIGKTNPNVGALLDEFTSMHAEYLAELRAAGANSAAHADAIELFSESARMIYKRLRVLDSEQSAMMKDWREAQLGVSRIH
jgi:hypothetical protein